MEEHSLCFCLLDSSSLRPIPHSSVPSLVAAFCFLSLFFADPPFRPFSVSLRFASNLEDRRAAPPTSNSLPYAPCPTNQNGFHTCKLEVGINRSLDTFRSFPQNWRPSPDYCQSEGGCIPPGYYASENHRSRY
jgi:hypothetical protein